MGGDRSFVRRKRSGGWKGTVRLYGAFGENSIDFPRILYRLFPDNSEQTLGRYGSNDLIVWENRSVSIVQLLRPLGRKLREVHRSGGLRCADAGRLVRKVGAKGRWDEGG